MPKTKTKPKKLPAGMMSLRVMTRSFRDVQGQRIMTNHRVKQLVRAKVTTKEQAEEIYEQTLGYLEQAEKALDKKVKQIVRAHPVWEWAKHVKGIGERLCGAIMGELGDISFFPSAGHVWAYCGFKVIKTCPNCGEDRKLRFLEECNTKGHKYVECGKCGFIGSPVGKAQRRMKGRKNTWNASLKTLCRLTAECLIKRPNPYREAYLTYKKAIVQREVDKGHTIWQKSAAGVVSVAHGDPNAQMQNYVCSKCKRVARIYAQSAPNECGKCGSELVQTTQYSAHEWTLGRIHNMALRWLAKLFLSHLWEVWCKAEGLPHKDQYANKFLGHVPYDDPWDYADQRKNATAQND